jgi:Glycosyltransferase family 9 (heptosyltransferase)
MITTMLKFLTRYANTAPFHYKMELDSEFQDVKCSRWNQLQKLLSRQLFLIFSGQFLFHRQKILAKHKHIHRDRNVGDSLMRLSGLALLNDRTIDLLAYEPSISLFRFGPYIKKTFLLGKDKVEGNNYDLVIIDGILSGVLKAKMAVSYTIPFVTMYENVYRIRHKEPSILFSYYRIAELLGRKLTRDYLDKIATNKIDLSDSLVKWADNELNETFIIAVACGGVDSYRTYAHIYELVNKLVHRYPYAAIILVGSNNGGPIAQEVMEKITANAKVVNYVAKCSLLETAALIKKSNLLICPDGGLMHVATAVSTPCVALFGGITKPEFRLTSSNKVRTLRNQYAVSFIHADEILHELMMLLESIENE